MAGDRQATPEGDDTIMRLSRIATLLAVPLLLFAAACGDDGSEAATDGGTGTEEPSATASEDQAVEFARCMRENGIDVPDPDPDTGRVQLPTDGSIDIDSDEFLAAFEACQEFAQFGSGEDGQNPADDPETQEAMLEFAQCMRDNGVDMSDPQAGEGFGALREQADDPDFQDAFEVCQPILTDVFGEEGPGAGGA